MPFCRSCGYEMKPDARFCLRCGEVIQKQTKLLEEQRKQEYFGSVVKCPNCGEPLKSFEALCPACGYEFNAAQVDASYHYFVEQLQVCDQAIADSSLPPKRGVMTWSRNWKIFWVILNILTLCIPLAIYLVLPLLGIWGSASFSPEEKVKSALIKNYIPPVDRTTILEFMLLIKGQMSFLIAEKINRHTVHWAGIWGHKAGQLYQRAELAIQGDDIAGTAYQDILDTWKKIKKSFSLRAGAALGGILALIIFVFSFGGPFRLLSSPFKSESILSSGLFSEKLSWPDTEMSRMLPKPKTKHGHVWINHSDELQISLEKITDSQFNAYVKNCEQKGFVIDKVRETDSFRARNAEGYRLRLDYTDILSMLDIELEAPIRSFKWPESDMGKLVPKPNSTQGKVILSDDEKMQLTVYGLSEDQFASYKERCIKSGFSMDSESKKLSYKAYNESGYFLKLDYQDIDDRGLSIECVAPMQMTIIRWPKLDLVQEIPTPSSDLGNIDYESRTSFRVYVTNTSLDEYADYVDRCIDMGFQEGLYHREEKHFHAKNAEGTTLTVDYEGFNTIIIDVYNYQY